MLFPRKETVTKYCQKFNSIIFVFCSFTFTYSVKLFLFLLSNHFMNRISKIRSVALLNLSKTHTHTHTYIVTKKVKFKIHRQNFILQLLSNFSCLSATFLQFRNQ